LKREFEKCGENPLGGDPIDMISSHFSSTGKKTGDAIVNPNTLKTHIKKRWLKYHP
jgi:hypothetical protein